MLFRSRLFREPNNKLSIYTVLTDDGYINIDQEKTYKIRYELIDVHGNKKTLKFNISGVPSDIPEKVVLSDNLFNYKKENKFKNKEFNLTIPKDALYDDLYFTYEIVPDSLGLSSIHKVHNRNTPLHIASDIRIKILNDTIEDKSKYYVGALSDNLKSSWSAGGKYKNGWMELQTRSFGNYNVLIDLNPPVINPINPENWAASNKITLKIWDGETGISDWKCTIDDNFALFEYDGKTSTITHTLDSSKTQKGKKHIFKISVTDNCGNVSAYEKDFVW